MTNIRCSGQKEIDLLAVNPKTGEMFHVESHVWTERRLNSTELAELVENKFNDSKVKEKISEFLKESDYKKWLVVSPQDVNQELNEYARKRGIEIWYIDVMVNMIMEKMKRFGSRDHIIRMLEIVKLREKWQSKHRGQLTFEKP
jgi:hypothetical protein